MQRTWHRIEAKTPAGHALSARVGGHTWITWERADGRWQLQRDGQRVAVVGSLPDARAHAEGRTMPKHNPKKVKTFQFGDLVRYTSDFLRSIGQYKGGPIDGVVVGETSLGPIVVWNDDNVPRQVGSRVLEQKKTTQSREALISAVRLAIGQGLPIGKASTSWGVYARPKSSWKKLGSFDNEHDAKKRAESYYDEHESTQHVEVLDKEGHVVLSLQNYNPSSNPSVSYRRYYPFTDRLNPDWIKAKQGVIVTESWAAHELAAARAAYHGKPEAIHRKGQTEWLVQPSSSPSVRHEGYVLVKVVKPAAVAMANPVALPKDAVYFVTFDDGRRSARRVKSTDASKLITTPGGQPASFMRKSVLLVSVLPKIYGPVWRSSQYVAMPLWDWNRGRLSCKGIGQFVTDAFREEEHREKKSRAYHAFHELQALLCGPIENTRRR